MSQRKIVQISSVFCAEGGGYAPESFVHALCDDGSLWVISQKDEKWERFPSIPQPEEKADTSADRQHRKVRHPTNYLNRNYSENLVRMDDGWWRYESTDVDAEGKFDNLHRARSGDAS